MYGWVIQQSFRGRDSRNNLARSRHEEKLEKLIQLANDRGGEDNISLVLWVDDGDEEGVSTC